jgi:hypothetical protein
MLIREKQEKFVSLADLDVLFDRIIENYITGCWELQGYRDIGGYCQVTMHNCGHVLTIRAHKLFYILAYGFVPEGKLVLHKCDIPYCVCPSHLYLGTQIDNMDDMITRGRQRMQLGTSNPNNRILNESIVRHIKTLYYTGNVTQQEIADAYGVPAQTISNIITERTWSHINV